LLLGTIVGLYQTKIKRLLAYSTISHIGFILLALAISTEQSIESMIFYIIQYTITNLNSFLIIIALSYVFHDSILINILEKYKNKETNDNRSLYNNENINFSDISFISELKNQFSYNPLLSLGLSISLFSMAGIPPLIGFFSKQFVLSSAIQNGYYFMAIIAILVSVISASYYLKIIRVLHTEIDDSNVYKHVDLTKINSESSLTNIHSFFISILTSIILFFVIKPSIILSSIRILSLSMFYC
jgi:NADH-ubiquinone oxidoreductase chain 2